MVSQLNVVKLARKKLGLTQEDFGKWLGERIGGDHAVSKYRVSEWERGVAMPRENIREACMDIALEQATSEIMSLYSPGMSKEERLSSIKGWLRDNVFKGGKHGKN